LRSTSATGCAPACPSRSAPGSLYLGLGEGLLSWAAFGQDLHTLPALTAVWLTTLGGGALGALLGYVIRPHRADSRLVFSAAVWAFSWMGLAMIAIEPENDAETFQWIFGAMNAGMVAGAILAAATHMSEARVWLLNAGFFGGAVVATIFPGVGASLADDREINPDIVAIALGVGSAAGLALTLFLTRDMNRDEPAPDVAPTASFTEGGAVFGVQGQL
jgi:hypothetical protein